MARTAKRTTMMALSLKVGGGGGGSVAVVLLSISFQFAPLLMLFIEAPESGETTHKGPLVSLRASFTCLPKNGYQ